MPGPFILIAAFSGRAVAMSARAAGFVPLVADLFADDDTRAVASGVRRVAGDIASGFDEGALIEALAELAAGSRAMPVGLVYGAGFEDRPALLAQIAQRWPLLGNAPQVVAAVKDPQRLAHTLGALGVPHPEIRTVHEAGAPGWLLKRRGGAGGGHVGAFFSDDATGLRRENATEQKVGDPFQSNRSGMGSGHDHAGPDHRAPDAPVYSQRRVTGRSVSALFLADGAETQIIGFSDQWTSPAPDQPFRFGGAVCPADIPGGLAADLGEAVRKVAGAFGLVGLNSADFIVGADAWWLIEINPRFGATLDIFDAPGANLVAAHLAVQRGAVPPQIVPARQARALQILYAPVAIPVFPSIAWPDWAADRPHQGQSILADAPLCTILASAEKPCEARRLCQARANQIIKLMGVEECIQASAASRESA